MMLIGELKSWLSAFADDEEVAIVDCGGLSLETRTDGLAIGGWPEDGEELTCILTADNMHTVDDCTLLVPGRKPSMLKDLQRYADPNDPGNSPRHHTGKPCIETGCEKPAGTAWSALWCIEHNTERMRRIDKQFEALRRALSKQL